jgi:hypothetical protein
MATPPFPAGVAIAAILLSIIVFAPFIARPSAFQTKTGKRASIIIFDYILYYYNIARLSCKPFERSFPQKKTKDINFSYLPSLKYSVLI